MLLPAFLPARSLSGGGSAGHAGKPKRELRSFHAGAAANELFVCEPPGLAAFWAAVAALGAGVVATQREELGGRGLVQRLLRGYSHRWKA